MKRNWISAIGGTLVALSLAGAGGAFAQEYNDWDTNADGGIDYEEWDTGFDDEGVFDSWDANDDGMLDDQEYGEGIYNTYDNDGDGALNEEEYGTFQDDAGDEGFWDV